MFDKNQPIKTIAEVKAFAIYLFYDLGIVFHPDDDFADYTDNKTGMPTFTADDAQIFNRRMTECFRICGSMDADVYDEMDVVRPYLEALHNGMDERQAKETALSLISRVS